MRSWKKTALFMDKLHALRLRHIKDLNFYPRVILDIGSHKGEWGYLAHKLWPKAEIYMIEANIQNSSDLESLDWIRGYEIALLGEKKKKKVKYFASRNNFTTGNSIYLEQTHTYSDALIRYLPMTTLDEIVSKRKLTNIDLVKIDTQGSELDIIRGGKKTISKAEFILVETQTLEFNKNAPFIAEIISEMKKRNFVLFDIIQIHYLASGEMAQADVVFTRKNSRFIKTDGLLQ